MIDSDILNDLYYNKHNYDGITNLYEKAKQVNPNINKGNVKEWLDSQSAHQQTAVKIGKKEYLPIYSETPYSFQIDLTFFPRYATRNKNYSVLFSMAPFNNSGDLVNSAPITCDSPFHFGSSTPEMNSFWFKLYLYQLV